MNPNKQRIAIAEACGWVFMDGGNFSGIDYKSVKPPHGLTYTMSHRAAILSTPDYLVDLNAMHEAEKVLTDKQYNIFALRLGPLTSMRRRQYISATATQRAEAFLRTIGKWEE